MEDGIPILRSRAVDKGSEKRLKRGLHDLSPLFQSPVSRAPAPPPSLPVLFGVQFLTVCVPDHEGDAFLANAYVASQLVRQSNLFVSLISVTPGRNPFPSKSNRPFPPLELLDARISRLSLSHEELWNFTRNGLVRPESEAPFPSQGNPQGFLVFLEFEPAQFRSLSQIALLLDRVVFFIPPEVGSLREAYRLIKIFSHFNREIEFLLLFRGRLSTRAQEEFLFERFSLITSRFLGISSGWLGELAFPEKMDQPVDFLGEGLDFNPELLLDVEGLHRPLAPEKNRFWHPLRKILQNQFSHELAPKQNA